MSKRKSILTYSCLIPLELVWFAKETLKWNDYFYEITIILFGKCPFLLIVIIMRITNPLHTGIAIHLKKIKGIDILEGMDKVFQKKKKKPSKKIKK
jgi:hypothetical protein